MFFKVLFNHLKILYLISILLLFSCGESSSNQASTNKRPNTFRDVNMVTLVLLGTIQDAGSPHIACKKECCKNLFENPDPRRQVVSLGLVDNPNKKKYLFEATPNITSQMKYLVGKDITNANEMVDGIFLTHAHMGHYSGLMYLGKEATNADKVEVYAMPRMKSFLEYNGPWSQLVTENNISIIPLTDQVPITLSSLVQVIPFVVPHRDEYSETVGYKIIGPNKTALFIPDIDKWEKWDKNILEEIKKVDFAFLDATFFSGQEINNRDISEIPHPFMVESLETFKALDSLDRKKVTFIHFNHTNPVINHLSKEAEQVKGMGFNIGQIYDSFAL